LLKLLHMGWIGRAIARAEWIRINPWTAPHIRERSCLFCSW
jgi:hypothetical protein